MPIKAYKGFNKDMTCRGFQFEEGKSYEEPEAKLCESGFHACLNPLDCFNYYHPAKSEFHEVELYDVSNEHGNDTKVCAKQIKIGAKLDILGMCKAHFEFVKSKTTNEQIGENNSNVSAGDESSVSAGWKSSVSAGNASSVSCRGKASSGKNGLIAVRGNGCKAKGGIGTVIVIVNEYDDKYDIAEWKAGVIDGETLKPDTWYKLENGEFVECE